MIQLENFCWSLRRGGQYWRVDCIIIIIIISTSNNEILQRLVILVGNRLFTTLYFLALFSIVEPEDTIARELDVSAKARLDWVGGED